MSKSLEVLKEAYGGDFPDPERWQLGPLKPGSHIFDTMPCQLIDGPGHSAKIEIHGDYCDRIGKEIVEMLNAKRETE